MGWRLYDHPINSYQQHANAYVAAALPAYADKGRAARAAERLWKARPEREREQATRDLRARQRVSFNLTAQSTSPLRIGI